MAALRLGDSVGKGKGVMNPIGLAPNLPSSPGDIPMASRRAICWARRAAGWGTPPWRVNNGFSLTAISKHRLPFGRFTLLPIVCSHQQDRSEEARPSQRGKSRAESRKFGSAGQRYYHLHPSGRRPLTPLFLESMHAGTHPRCMEYSTCLPNTSTAPPHLVARGLPVRIS